MGFTWETPEEMDLALALDCAASCGILVPETKLLPSKRCSGYFTVRRFDRVEGKRVHMLTAAAILGIPLPDRQAAVRILQDRFY